MHNVSNTDQIVSFPASDVICMKQKKLFYNHQNRLMKSDGFFM